MLVLQTRFADTYRVGYRPHQGQHYVLVALGDKSYGIPWRAADELAMDLKRRLTDHAAAGCLEFSVTLSGTAWVLPRKLAESFRADLISKARDAEEQEKAPQIAYDAAILHRAGFPVGLSNDPTIKEEALKESQHNRELRRALPIVGVRSGEVLGTPTIESKPPVPEEKLS